MSDTAAQLLFDKENHISQLVVQTGAKHCVDICNPEATKSLNARDKLKVQSKIEVPAHAVPLIFRISRGISRRLCRRCATRWTSCWRSCRRREE